MKDDVIRTKADFVMTRRLSELIVFVEQRQGTEKRTRGYIRRVFIGKFESEMKHANEYK